LGAVTIEASDDSSLVGHRFEITTSLITLGRSADNDIIFPNDKPVSRHHAEIYQISDKLYLREVETADSSGAAKPPKYGTFLNEVPMGSDPALLKTGDAIQLGKRVRLRFESYRREADANALTSDDLSAADDLDRTQEQ
jgi:pSer/pThr/pTyr-binding forkhead associated (FHA) protein